MYFKLFLPVFILIIFQLLSLFFYNGFKYESNIYVITTVAACYIFSLLAIFLFCLVSKNYYNGTSLNILNKSSNFYLNSLILFLIFILINKPTFILYQIGSNFGFDYLRQNYYNSDVIRGAAYGNMNLAVLTQMYIVPFFWFYTFLLIDKKDKFSQILFYYLLISLVLLNISYAGRFNIYFAFLVVYLRNIILGESILYFFKKYLYIFALLFFVSMYISNLRIGADGLANDKDDFIKLFEYHAVQPHFFSQKILDGTLINDGYIFKLFFEGLFFPIYYIMGFSFSNTTIGYYSSVFGNPTLYSFNTDAYYNAFSTLYAYLFSDYGYFTPIFCFLILTYFLFSSFLISDYSARLKYVGFFSLMFYFSLFQAPLLFPGSLLILFFYPLIFLIFRKKI